MTTWRIGRCGRQLTVYPSGPDLYAFGLSTPCCRREYGVRLQRRELVEHDREIAGAGDILLDNVVVSFESIWHTLTLDSLSNVVFIEWNKPDQLYTNLGIIGILLPCLLFYNIVGLVYNYRNSHFWPKWVFYTIRFVFVFSIRQYK